MQESQFEFVIQKADYKPVAHKLAWMFDELITDFLQSYNLLNTGKAGSRWREIIRGAFEEAIKIKASLQLKQQTITFQTYEYRIDCDANAMIGLGQREIEPDSKVLCAYFPAMKMTGRDRWAIGGPEVDHQGPIMDTILLKAVIHMQQTLQ